MTPNNFLKNDAKKQELTECLKNYLPTNVAILWAETSGTLIFKMTDTKEVILQIKYGYPPYPASADCKILAQYVNSILRNI